jgi:NADH-quinone oxidoreductase subunit E
MAEAGVKTIVARHGFHENALIAVLQEIQRQTNWLPPEDLATVARLLRVPESRVYGIATFYRAFSLKPRGKYVIHVCLGTACHVRGGVRVKEALERELGVAAGETTADKLFTLETVNCLGACALGPIAVVNGMYYGHMNSQKVTKMLSACSAEAEKVVA